MSRHSSPSNEQDPAAPPPSDKPPRGESNIFGLGQMPKYLAPQISEDEDYEEKYPPDEPFKGMSPTARVWKVFVDEFTKFDMEMIAKWRDALDTTLLFSAMFSVVVAAFVSQTSRELRVDYRAVTAGMLPELIELQRALAEGRPASDVPRSPINARNAHLHFRPKTSHLVVNGLWFTALGLSLLTTLVSILAKQWINVYSSIPSGTARDCARIRHMRYMGLENWHVPLIINLLPLVMHASVGMFFVGLITFCASFSTTMSGVLSGIASTALFVYLISTVQDIGMKRTERRARRESSVS